MAAPQQPTGSPEAGAEAESAPSPMAPPAEPEEVMAAPAPTASAARPRNPVPTLAWGSLDEDAADRHAAVAAVLNSAGDRDDFLSRLAVAESAPNTPSADRRAGLSRIPPPTPVSRPLTAA
jgi:hypothetical protein